MMLRYHYPYTYSYLTAFISTLEADPYAGKLFSRKPQLGLAQGHGFMCREMHGRQLVPQGFAKP